MQSAKIIIFEILNLPLSHRKKKIFQIVAAVIHGDNINQWLLLIFEQLQILSEGILTYDAVTGELFMMKVLCTPGIFDLRGFYECYYHIYNGGKLGCMLLTSLNV